MKTRILIIDDDAAHSTSTREILEAAGYEVYVHDRAFGGTALIRALRPALLLLDVNMPGLSGDGLAGVLRRSSITPDLRIVLYSSNDEDDLRATSRRLGLTGYISKGNVAALRARISEYFS